MKQIIITILLIVILAESVFLLKNEINNKQNETRIEVVESNRIHREVMDDIREGLN